jgi:DNA-directed RNA polymerase specialized sigma24 family protein
MEALATEGKWRMDHPGTITRIIRDLEGAERPRRDDAVRQLWERFFADLTVYARKRLRAMNAPMGPADEEDAASRAFTKVCRGIERGQLKLASRVDLTKVLRSATAREVFTLLSRARSSGGWSSEDDSALGQVPDPALAPDLLLLAFDACQRLLELLETDDLRQVAVWKLAGHTNAVIAAKLGYSAATVERTLSYIRETWRQTWVDAVPRGSAKPGPRRGSSTSTDVPGFPGIADFEADDADKILRDLAGLS